MPYLIVNLKANNPRKMETESVPSQSLARLIPSDASDDEIGLYVGAGFNLTDHSLGIRLAKLSPPGSFAG